MKKLFPALISIVVLFAFTQCEQKNEEVDTRTLITKKIQYDVPIMNDDPNYDWWIENIEGSDREDLLNNIFEQVLSGKIQAYDYFNEPLSVEQVNSLMADTLMQTLMRTTEPYTEYDTTIIKVYSPTDMSSLRFLEEWKYDPESLHIDKKVIGICPVMEVMVGNRKMRRPFFWVYFEDLK